MCIRDRYRLILHQLLSPRSVASNVYEGFVVVAMKFLVFVRSLPQWNPYHGLAKNVKRKHCVMFFSEFKLIKFLCQISYCMLLCRSDDGLHLCLCQTSSRNVHQGNIRRVCVYTHGMSIVDFKLLSNFCLSM